MKKFNRKKKHSLNLYFKAIKLLENKERKYLIILLFSSLLNGFLQLFALVGVIPFINLIIQRDEFFNTKFGLFLKNNFFILDINSALIFLGFALIFLILFKNIYSWYHIGFLSRFIARIEVRLRDDFLTKVLFSKYEWIKKYNSNYLREVVFNYAGAWSSQFIKPLLILKNELFILFFILITLIYLNPVVAFMLILISILIGVSIIFIIKRKIYNLEEIKRNSFVKAAHFLINAFQGINDIKMSQSEIFFQKNINLLSQKSSLAEAERLQWNLLPRLIIETFSYCTILFILVFLIFVENNIEQSASILAVYAFAAFRIMPLISSFVSNTASIINVTPLLEHLFKIKAETTLEEKNNKNNITLKHTLELKNIVFKYNDDKNVLLNKINLKIKKGKIYGIVGLSGAGKTTLINIISGLLYPSEGDILVDKTKIRPNEIKYLRNFISYVGQDAYIFDDGIEENIAFENNLNKLNYEKILEALKKSQLSDWINYGKIKKLDLGERGNKISGGQKQRLSIARAFYNNSDIIIFDEGTSALDGIQENEIKNILSELKKSTAIIMIAHKISTIQNCDQIFVLENGSILDYGTHRELKKSNKFYKTVVLNQMIKE